VAQNVNFKRLKNLWGQNGTYAVSVTRQAVSTWVRASYVLSLSGRGKECRGSCIDFQTAMPRM